MSTKVQSSFNEDRYADCEACNERYWGDDINIYIREVSGESESFSVCVDCRWGRTKFVREALKKAIDPSSLTWPDIVRLVKRLRVGAGGD